MTRIVIELHSFTSVWEAALLVSLIDDAIRDNEGVKEIRIEK